jgi:hypothetical protein
MILTGKKGGNYNNKINKNEKIIGDSINNFFLNFTFYFK